MGSLSRPRYRKAWARARRSRSPHCPLRGNRQWAARDRVDGSNSDLDSAQVRAPQPAAPAGPVVLVDHLVFRGAKCPCGALKINGSDAFTSYVPDAFAGYVADDVMGAGARPAFAAEIQHTMLVNNMTCCKHPYEGARAASSRTPSTR